MGIVAIILAILGMVDLFEDPGKRVLPWWGDLIAIGVAVVIYIVVHVVVRDDD